MKKSTQQKARLLMKALVAKHGDGSLVTRKQVKDVHATNSDFPNFGCITRNPDLKVAHGQFLITMKDNIIEQRDAKIAELEAKEAKQLPKNVRTSAKTLAKELMKDEGEKKVKPKAKKVRSTKTKSKAVVMPDYGNMDNLPEVADYVSQNDIDEAFGGNDINDILATL